MAVIEVPVSYRFVCDSCKAAEETKSKSRPKYWIDLHILRDAYDWQGNAAADGSVKLLLCLACAEAATKALNKALDERRAASGIEARSDETRSGSAVGESPTAESGDAQ